ncbi:MAG: hypothetical protein GY906_18085 [bacterium]|nr:hypothetical protein [bacterium]
MHLKQPFFRYDGTHLYPGVTAENIIETTGVERYDHTAADGTTGHCYIGDREFYEFTYRWLDSTAKADVVTWWEACKGGQAFELIFDDSVRKMDGTWDMDGTYTMGTDSDGDAITVTEYIVAQTELVFTPDEVDGYVQTTLRFRKTV